jgi:hypothetical protein
VSAPRALRGSAQQWFEPTPSGLDDAKTFTNLSALNTDAAGAHGFVRAKSGHFSDDRGTRLRFFGVNLSGVACLPDHETARKLSRHLRKLGFNAVRLRGLDAPGALMASDGQLLPEALDRLDFFTSELATQGIYFSLTLHAEAGYPGLDPAALSQFPAGRVLDRFHGPFLDAQKDYAARVLRHQSRYTGRPYGAEPALLYVELNDEDTLLPSRAGSPDDLPSSYRAELAQGYAPWLAERTADGLRTPGPALEEAEGGLPTFQSSASARVDYAEYLRATELGNVKMLAAYLRQDLGLRSMLIDSQASAGGLAGVLREAEVSDFVDVHAYWGGGRDASAVPANTPQLTAKNVGSLGVSASYRVFDKPFTVSEYASAAPSDYVAEMLPLLVGVAGFQDWDAVFAFAYADDKRDYEPARINGVFDMAGHPAKLAFVSMAASAFRRGLVAPGRDRVELSVPQQPITLPVTEDALPQLWNDHGVAPGAAVLRQIGISIRPGNGDVSSSFALHASGVLGSDTGELLLDNQGAHARFSVDAPALKLVCGMVANSLLKFDGISLEFGDFSPNFACASVLSLDEEPVARSRRVLLTVVGNVQNAHAPVSGGAAARDPWGAGPTLAQYVPVTLTLPASAWRAESLSATASAVQTLPVVTTDQSRISTSFSRAALSYALTR